MTDRGSWGFTDRPHPTMTGHVIATRQASGAQNVFRDAIEQGTFIAAHPPGRESRTQK